MKWYEVVLECYLVESKGRSNDSIAIPTSQKSNYTLYFTVSITHFKYDKSNGIHLNATVCVLDAKIIRVYLILHLYHYKRKSLLPYGDIKEFFFRKQDFFWSNILCSVRHIIQWLTISLKIKS